MPIIRIDSLGDCRLDAYARLTEAQLRNRLEPEKGIFIAESSKVIARALDAGYIPQSLLMEERWLEPTSEIVDRVAPSVPIFVLPSPEIEKLTGFELTRGILAAFVRPEVRDPARLLENARRIAVLEGIVDHTNVGAIFRSAAALGVDALLVTPNCCDPLYRRAVRVSMGTVFQVPWARLGNPCASSESSSIETLHDFGFTTAAFTLSDQALCLDDARLKASERLAMVFGAEGDGIAPKTIARCDYEVCIPMANGVDSLNVAAASAVAFWELCRK